MKHSELNEHEQKLVDMSEKEFDQYMMSNYSDMFKNRYTKEGQEMILPMNFGFEIGPGWRHVLDSLCQKLRLISAITGFTCIFDQIKEKFGGARFYYHIEGAKEENVTLGSGDISREIIQDLVAMHEEYCDYVCDELGTNIMPKEKIVLGGWCYGCGIEGFKKLAAKRWGGTQDKVAQDRIALAEKCVEKNDKVQNITTNLHGLNDEKLDSVLNYIKNGCK